MHGVDDRSLVMNRSGVTSTDTEGAISANSSSSCCGLLQTQRHLAGLEEGALRVTAFLAEILCSDAIYRQNSTFSSITFPLGSGFPAAMQ